MLKVCTSYSKKVPTDQQYSSQQSSELVDSLKNHTLTGTFTFTVKVTDVGQHSASQLLALTISN